MQLAARHEDLFTGAEALAANCERFDHIADKHRGGGHAKGFMEYGLDVRALLFEDSREIVGGA